jgi:galactokinase
MAEMEATGSQGAQDRAVAAFRRLLGGEPALLVRAPGRVNLIGEHTDYNQGFVLPMAIDRAVWIALRPREKPQVTVHAADLGGTLDFQLQQITKGGPGWGEYVKGVAWCLTAAGHTLAGWEGVVAGDVPIGAGLSSSAALEVAAARAFAAVSGLAWDPLAMAHVTQRAENEWVGVPCGVMDQLASVAGIAGHALLIDCRTLELSPVPVPPGVVFVVLDTGTRRAVAASAYQERREQCQQAARFLGVASLREATLQDLAGASAGLSEILLRRARHVLSENERTLQAAQALRRGDAIEVGNLMDASHASMRDDFEISTPELDAIVSVSRRRTDCLGARLTGAGFGGCALALVRQPDLAVFVSGVRDDYRVMTGREASLYACAPAAGAEVMELGGGEDWSGG